MQTYSVRPIKKNSKFTVSVPGSKSITNRALLIAALANGRTKLKGTLFSDDSRYFLSSLISLGFEVNVDEENTIYDFINTIYFISSTNRKQNIRSNRC